MAPARMMQFVDQHVKNCRICQADLLLPDEVEKIREFVLPESKIPKASRSLDDTTPEISPGEEDDFDEDDEYVDDTDDELDEDDIDDDEEDDLSDDDVI